MKHSFFILFAVLLFSACQSPATEEENVKAPELVKEVVESYRNGNPKSEKYYTGGTIELVKQVTYYENGAMQQSGTFKDGKRHGAWQAFFEDGKEWSLNTYENGELSGPYKTWFDSGNLRIEGTYLNGEPTGTWKYYNEEGEIVREDER